MVAVFRGGQEVFDAEYDYRTRRLAKTEGAETTVYRYDGGTSFQEVQDGVITLELLRGTGMGGGIGSILYTDRHDNSGGATSLTTEYFAYNAVGHTVALTDTSGDVTKTNAYEAFGSVIAETGTSQNNKFANTKERDTSTALDNHGFRYYDPSTGLYVTRDPIGYGDGLNVYLYVGGNPVNRVDPQGLSAWIAFWNTAGSKVQGMKDGISHTVDYAVAEVQYQAGNISYAELSDRQQKAPGFQIAMDTGTVYRNATSTGNSTPDALVMAGGYWLAESVGLNAMYEAYTDESTVTGMKYNRSGWDRWGAAFSGLGQFLNTVAGSAKPVTSLARRTITPNAPSPQRTGWTRPRGEAGDAAAGRVDSAFVEQMTPEEAARYREYWSQDYNDATTRKRDQMPPGTRSVTDEKVSSMTGEVYKREAIYDQYGRRIGNNDYTTHGRPQDHTNPHHHVRDPVTGHDVNNPRVHPGPHPETLDAD